MNALQQAIKKDASRATDLRDEIEGWSRVDEVKADTILLTQKGGRYFNHLTSNAIGFNAGVMPRCWPGSPLECQGMLSCRMPDRKIDLLVLSPDVYIRRATGKWWEGVVEDYSAYQVVCLDGMDVIWSSLSKEQNCLVRKLGSGIAVESGGAGLLLLTALRIVDRPSEATLTEFGKNLYDWTLANRTQGGNHDIDHP